MRPKRIQRTRAKGWRLPEGAVIVDRTSRWGNPNRIVGRHAVIDKWGDARGCENGEARGVAVRLFREQLLDGRLDFTLDDAIEQLRGKDLACFCTLDQACHADVLLELVNIPLDPDDEDDDWEEA